MKYILCLLLLISLSGCGIYHNIPEQLNYLQGKYPDCKVFPVPEGEAHESFVVVRACGQVLYIHLDNTDLKKMYQVEVSPCNKPL